MAADKDTSPAFTDQERAEIAARFDRIAADRWREHRELVARDPNTPDFGAAAIGAEAVAKAARTSSEALARIAAAVIRLHH